MALFALPIPAASTSRQSAETKSVRYKLDLPSRKRKRGSEFPTEAEDENSLSDNDDLPPASTNPLSLTPAEILQYRLAGLELNQPLPNRNDFPHRGLLASKISATNKKTDVKGKGRAVDLSDEVSEEEQKETELNDTKGSQILHGSRLRMQHFRVLVAILHKCLLEGDIKRGLHAWTLLLRVQFSGQMVDIRSTGYWAIGAELLARSEDRRQHLAVDPVNEDEEADEEGDIGADKRLGGEKEWGTKTGRAKAVNYLGSMVLEFPFNKQHWRTISAIDFWPSMLAIEIYGIQFEQREALKRIDVSAEKEASDDESDGSQVDEDSGQIQYDDSYAAAERRLARRKYRKEEKVWKKKDEVRTTTMTAINSVTARVDELLSDPLYNGNITISEIRAHISIFIGDLSVPEKFPELESEGEEDELESSSRRKRPIDTEKRMLFRQRINEYEAGRRTQAEEIRRAAKIARKILKDGGNVDAFRALNLEETMDD